MELFKKDGRKLIFESYDRLQKEWGIFVEEKDLTTKYGVTHILIAGNKENPPLLLFHGVGDNSALMWIYNASYLSKYFYIFAIDVMGGPGKSEPNEAYEKSFDACIWINEILEALQLQRVNIAGVSNGSYLARHFTAKNPDRVNKIVCMAGGVTLNMLKMLTLFLPEALFPSERNTKKLLKKLCAPTSHVFEDDETIFEHWNLLLKYFNNQSMMYHKYEQCKEEDFAILRQKALFLIGEYDRLTNYPKSIKDLDMHGLNYKIVKNAGHGINHEQADLINQEIVGFLL